MHSRLHRELPLTACKVLEAHSLHWGWHWRVNHSHFLILYSSVKKWLDGYGVGEWNSITVGAPNFLPPH